MVKDNMLLYFEEGKNSYFIYSIKKENNNDKRRIKTQAGKWNNSG